ncbi:MAG: hypothetical protein QMD71_06085 [bacterium]|nr:hypothetical protein [bacterium]
MGRVRIGILTVLSISLLVFAFGCAKKVKIPVPKKVGPLAQILVYVGEVPLGESGRSADGTELEIGGSVVFTAQGRDANFNPMEVNPTWTPTKPGIVEITPPVGSKVTVTGLKEGTIDIEVEADGVKKLVEFITVR